MVKKYITENGVLCAGKESCPGSWISLVSPTYEECDALAREFHIDIADVRAALDDEESSRVDVNDEYTLVLFDIPSIEYRHEREAYTTIPLGLILTGDVFISVCGEDTPVDEAVYLRWLEGHTEGSGPLPVEWFDLTEENIARLQG